MGELADYWPLPEGAGVRDRLQEAYADPARGYHDLRHLEEVCARVEELTSRGDLDCDLEAVLLAAWFHDAVYDGRPFAEERSAAWAEDDLPALVTAPATVAEVARLVRLTERHRPAEGDVNGAVLCDADLAILAAPWDRYAEYAADVRREYPHVPDPDFRSGRAAVLRDLLAKPELFHTAYARAHWENVARANVERELVDLEG
jgi:predicted metal-dependent HD superfamily phosphohydrolase